MFLMESMNVYHTSHPRGAQFYEDEVLGNGD